MIENVCIKKRQAFERRIYPTQPGQIIRWKFSTFKKNISFGVKYSSMGDDGENLAALLCFLNEPSSNMLKCCNSDHLCKSSDRLYKSKDKGSIVNHKDEIFIISLHRVECSREQAFGWVKAPVVGTYTFIFDNSFSMHRSKRLSFEISVISEDAFTSLSSLVSNMKLDSSFLLSSSLSQSTSSSSSLLTPDSNASPEVKYHLPQHTNDDRQHLNGRSHLLVNEHIDNRKFSVSCEQTETETDRVQDTRNTASIISNDKILVDGDGNISFSGWLLKKRSRIRGWARRWVSFSTCDGLLNYSRRPGGRIHDSLCVSSGTILQIPDRLRFICDSGHSLLHFKTYSISEFKLWIRIFSFQYQFIQQKNLSLSDDNKNLNPTPNHNKTTICPNCNTIGQADAFSIEKTLRDVSFSLNQLVDKVSTTSLEEITKVIENDIGSLLVASQMLKSQSRKPASLRSPATSIYASSIYTTADEEFQTDMCENIFLLSAEETEALSDDADGNEFFTNYSSEEDNLGYKSDSSFLSATVADKGLDSYISSDVASLNSTDSKGSTSFNSGHCPLHDGTCSVNEFPLTQDTLLKSEDFLKKDRIDNEHSSVIIRTKETSSLLKLIEEHLDRDEDINMISRCENIKPFTPLGRIELPISSPVSIKGVSLFSLLKVTIGRNSNGAISSMPVCLNEPLGLLQRLCEELSHSYFLDAAALLDRIKDPEGSIAKLALVTMFAISGYTFTRTRTTRKPFTPLLGETFQFVHPKTGMRFMSERVSHSPPIVACHASGGRSDWNYYQDLSLKTRFWGRSLELFPTGRCWVQFPHSGDIFSWGKVSTVVHNVVGGTPWIEHFGEMIVQCHTRPQFLAVVDFCKEKKIFFSEPKNEIRGAIYYYHGNDCGVELPNGKAANGLLNLANNAIDDLNMKCRDYAGHHQRYQSKMMEPMLRISGTWHSEVFITEKSNIVSSCTPKLGINLESELCTIIGIEKNSSRSFTIPKTNTGKLSRPNPHDATDASRDISMDVSEDAFRDEHHGALNLPYGFRPYSVMLNDMVVVMETLAPTDSRLRPDQRLYEQGHVESADEEKKRLEQLQRSKNLADYEPLWFEEKNFHVTKRDHCHEGQNLRFWAARSNKFWKCAEQRSFPQLSNSLW